MQQIGKKDKANQSFLDKFKGKTSKISKEGLNNLLEKAPMEPPLNKNIKVDQKPIRQRVKQTPQQSKQDQPLRKVDLDQIIPSNPNRNSTHSIQKRVTNNKKISGNKIQYVPTVFTPSRQGKNINPPSRSASHAQKLISSKQQSKYTFGKYLKLDQQALRHLQFLQEVQKKANNNRSTYSKVTQR